MKTLYLKVKYHDELNLSDYPNFDKSGSITGMKKMYYGINATLIQCGNYIYNVPLEVYNKALKIIEYGK